MIKNIQRKEQDKEKFKKLARWEHNGKERRKSGRNRERTREER